MNMNLKPALTVIGLSVALSGCYLSETEAIKNHGVESVLPQNSARIAVETQLEVRSRRIRNLTIGPVRVGDIGEVLVPLKTHFVCVAYEHEFRGEWTKWRSMMALNTYDGQVSVYTTKPHYDRAYIENCKGQSHG